MKRHDVENMLLSIGSSRGCQVTATLHHLHLLSHKARSAADLPGLLCRDLRAQGQTLSLVQLWSIASQLTSALLYLRDRNIVHFDLKVSCSRPCRLWQPPTLIYCLLLHHTLVWVPCLHLYQGRQCIGLVVAASTAPALQHEAPRLQAISSLCPFALECLLLESHAHLVKSRASPLSLLALHGKPAVFSLLLP